MKTTESISRLKVINKTGSKATFKGYIRGTETAQECFYCGTADVPANGEAVLDLNPYRRVLNADRSQGFICNHDQVTVVCKYAYMTSYIETTSDEWFLYDYASNKVAVFEISRHGCEFSFVGIETAEDIQPLPVTGVWQSSDVKGTSSERYTFREDGTYLKELFDDAWKIASQGKYKYKDNIIAIEIDDGLWREISYAANDGNVMIFGFKRLSRGRGVEGDWELSTGMVKNMDGKLVNVVNFFTLSLHKGEMKVREETTSNGKSDIVDYTGFYHVIEDLLFISGTEVQNPFYCNGVKKICIIDNVLLPLNEMTITSYFNRVK